MKEAKGYQYLENKFFDLCETRKLRPLSLLLYIYLRGQYALYGKSDFFCPDRTTLRHLGITTPTLQKCRKELSEKGLLVFKSGTAHSATQYTMIGNVLLPNREGVQKSFTRVQKSFTQGKRNFHPEDKETSPLNNRVSNRVNKRVTDIFSGLTDEQRQELRLQGLLK